MSPQSLDEWLEWCYSSALGIGIVIALQLLVLTLVASLASRLMSKVSVSRNYGIWLTATIIALLLVPVHFLSLRWPLSIASVTPSTSVAIQDRIGSEQSNHIDFNGLNSESTFATNALPSMLDVHFNMQRQASAGIKTEGITARASKQSPGNEVFVSLPFSYVTKTAVAVYFAGLFTAIIRILHWNSRVSRMVRHAKKADEAIQSAAERIAQSVGCGSRFRIRQSDEAMTPMVIGMASPIIMLPESFSTWSPLEQRATLLHELTHVKRWDVLFRYLSLFCRTIYWFHPACRLIDQRLVESREWATDRDAISQAAEVQMDAISYAQSLVAVVSRLSHHPNPCTVVAMSLFDDIEHRLQLILNHSQRPDRNAKWFSRAAIITLLLLSGLFAARFRVAHAQPPAESVQTQGKPQSESIEKSANSTLDAPPKIASAPVTTVLPDHFDLVNRVQTAQPVASRHDATTITMVSVSGVVVDSNGVPVPDADVLLRESSTARLSYDRLTVSSYEELYLREVNDVLAKTKSDDQGRFQFNQIPAPGYALPDIRWRGNIAAAHPRIGVGYFNLDRSDGEQFQAENVSVTLDATTSINGQVVSADNQPVPNAVVSVVNLFFSAGTGFSSLSIFDLQGSQITPRVATDTDGQFQLSGIPKHCVATLAVFDPDSTGAVVAVKASSNFFVPESHVSSWRTSGPPHGNPVKIVTDPGIRISGKVTDENGAPVGNARIRFGAMSRSFLSQSSGDIDLHIPNTFKINHWQPRGSSPRSITIVVTPEDREQYLPARIDYPSSDSDYGRPFSVVLPTPISIIGRVTDVDGNPLEEVGVRSTSNAMHRYGQSDENGEYELLVPAGKHQLVYFSDREDLDLPRRQRGYDLPSDLAGYLTQVVDVSDGKPASIAPMVVPKRKAFQVSVILPSGEPAPQATVVLRDEKRKDGSSDYGTLPMVEEKADLATTDSQGQLIILPKAKLTNVAWLDCTLIQNDRAYIGQAKFSGVLDGALTMQLKETALITGRVLVNGIPISDAKVHLQEHRRYPRNAPTGQFDFVASFPHQIVTTDQNGRYRFAAPQGELLYVSLHSVPDLPPVHTSEHLQLATDEQIVEVKDFAIRYGSREIRGRVVDESGNPVARATVRAMDDLDADRYGWNGFLPGSQLRTDSNGNFRIQHLPHGKLYLYVERERRPPLPTSRLSTVVEVGASETQVLVRLPGLNPKP